MDERVVLFVDGPWAGQWRRVHGAGPVRYAEPEHWDHLHLAGDFDSPFAPTFRERQYHTHKILDRDGVEFNIGLVDKRLNLRDILTQALAKGV